MMKKKLYGAYGSNLNVEQMLRRCPTAELVGFAKLEGYELLYKGSKTGAYLTVERNKNESVPIGIWLVDTVDEFRLDIYEGYPSFYYKKEFNLEVTSFATCKKKKESVFLYIMNKNRIPALPSRSYVNTCNIGYLDFNFDRNILEQAYARTAERIFNNGKINMSKMS